MNEMFIPIPVEEFSLDLGDKKGSLNFYDGRTATRASEAYQYSDDNAVAWIEAHRSVNTGSQTTSYMAIVLVDFVMQDVGHANGANGVGTTYRFYNSADVMKTEGAVIRAFTYMGNKVSAAQDLFTDLSNKLLNDGVVLVPPSMAGKP